MLLGEVEQIGPGLEGPVTPGSNHLDVRIEGIGGKFEANLVVAFSGRAVCDRVGACLFRDFDEAFGDKRAGDGRAEQIDTFVNGIGTEHRENEITDEFFAKVINVDFLDAEHLRLLACRLQFLALAEICSEGHHLAAEFRLQPFQNDGCVEAAGIGQHDFLDVSIRHFGEGPVRSFGGSTAPLKICGNLAGSFSGASPSIQPNGRPRGASGRCMKHRCRRLATCNCSRTGRGYWQYVIETGFRPVREVEWI